MLSYNASAELPGVGAITWIVWGARIEKSWGTGCQDGEVCALGWSRRKEKDVKRLRYSKYEDSGDETSLFVH